MVTHSFKVVVLWGQAVQPKPQHSIINDIGYVYYVGYTVPTHHTTPHHTTLHPTVPLHRGLSTQDGVYALL